MTRTDMHPPPDPDRLRALEDALDRIQAGTLEEAEFRRRHPTHADSVLAEVAFLQQLDGLGGPAPAPTTLAPTPARGRPERLGAFELREEIGRGGMGVVYAAHQAALDRVVAVKILHGDLPPGSTARRRFEREAALSARLSHPAIVRVHAFGEEQGVSYLAMERIDGPSLQQVLAGVDERSDEAFADAIGAARPEASAGGFRGYVERIVEIGIAVADALQAAHDARLIHRDVKPANILIDREGRPHLADFGLAREHASRSLTASGSVLGTPGYLAPECIEGTPADERSDVFSLGATLYEALSGVPPFGAATVAETLNRVLKHDPRSIDALDRRLPADLANVIGRAIEKSPAARYQRAADFRDDLLRFRRGEPVTAMRVGFFGRTWRRCRRRPLQAALSGGLVVALVVAVIGVGAIIRRGASDRRAAREKVAEGQTLLDAGNVGAAIVAFDAAARLDPALAAARAGANASRRMRAARELKRRHDLLLSQVLARYLVSAPPLRDATARIDGLARDGVAARRVVFLRAIAALARGDADAARSHVAGLPENGLDARWIRARAAALLGDHAIAERELASARQIQPRTLEETLSAVEVHCGASLDLPAAETFLRTAAERWPTLAYVPFRQGLLRSQAGRFALAFDGARAALRLEPDFVEAATLRAETCLARGERKAARTYAAAIIERDPEYSPAYGALAKALFWSGDRDEAFRGIERALRARPDDPWLRHYLGRLHQYSGRFAQALETYSRTRHVGGEFAADYVNLLFLMKRDEEASTLVDDALAQRNIAVEHIARMLAIRADHTLDGRESERDLRRSVELVRDPRTLSLLSDVLMERHRYDEALEFASELIAIGVRRPRSLAVRGVCRLMRLDAAGAIRDLDRAIPGLERDRFTRALHWPHQFRAWAALATGDEAKAIESLRESLRRRPTKLAELLLLDCLMRRGDVDGVRAAVRSRRPPPGYRSVIRAWLLARAGEREEALRVLASTGCRIDGSQGVAMWPSALDWFGLELAVTSTADDAAAQGEAILDGRGSPEALLALAPNAASTVRRAYLRWASGRLLLDRGKPRAALAHLEHAVEHLDWPEARIDVGLARAATGDDEGAFEAWTNVRPGSYGMLRIVVGLCQLGVNGPESVRRWLGNGLER